MQFDVKIINVGAPETTKTARGGYQSIQVAYERDGKVEGKKLMSFTNPKVYKDIQEFGAGDFVTVTAEKGEPNASGQSFWQWTSVSATGAQADPPATKAATGSGGGATTKAVSNYETREERELKQRYIVRQSSITAAINLLGTKAKTVEDVTNVAKQFEAYVFGEGAGTLADSLAEVYEEDVPL